MHAKKQCVCLGKTRILYPLAISCYSCLKNSHVSVCLKKTGTTGDNKKNNNLVTLAISCYSCLRNSRVSVCLKKTGATGGNRKNKILSLLQHLVTPV